MGVIKETAFRPLVVQRKGGDGAPFVTAPGRENTAPILWPDHPGLHTKPS